ncbi:hypothetical protein E2562_039034 [Oryza meyeriana var. granulata]|uniref:HhH-GPD domain-containing protein n=1 Tax=Oryza meyeriana var. granulata TaxID=110450 RepID=A0A6G1EDV3_9ORYZ|nr:hypothetical protein E2562_039034 [Oryza meyeriana var. granulata]
MSAAAVGEAMRQKRRKRRKRRNLAEEETFPHPPAAEESNPLSWTPPNPAASVPSAAPETPILSVAVAERRKERKRKREQAAAPSPPPTTPSAAHTSVRKDEEAAGVRKKKKRKRREHEEGPPAAAGVLFLEAVQAEATTPRTKEQPGSACQSRQPSDDQIHPAPPGEGRDEADGPMGRSVKSSSSKKPRVLSTREIIKMRIELRKQQPLPQGLFDPSNPNSNPPIQRDANHSSPFGAFFDQFCYKPSHQDRSPPLPRTPERLTRPLSRDHLSSGSSQLMANETCKINTSKTSKTTISKRKQPGSASLNQENTKLEEMEKPVRKARVKKERKPPPLLTSIEKQSDKYRRLPLDQLVPPPRSPHKLLQEKYASDPWKVIVICMLLNLTQGKQVRRKVKGFFKRYPDAQTAFNADPEKMAKYLAPLGLQRVKANRIQKFSKAYVEKEWTYITELCGVGKYAADAYAIFCAGKATEVVPADHKLVDYWKYVCFELPMIQQSQDMQEAGLVYMEHAVPKVEELAVCC